MTVPTCARCGCVRDPVLVSVLPCEQCGAATDQVQDSDLPLDDSWSGELGRETYEDLTGAA